MELEDLRNQWQEMSIELEKQKILTDKLIIEMTQNKFNNKLKSISIPETIGTFVCFAIAILILINFSKLDTWYLQVSGIFSAFFYIILPILSLKTIYGMKRIDISQGNYKDSLEIFAKNKMQFIKVQKWSYYLSFVLVIICLPVASKLIKGTDILLESAVWLWYLPFGFAFLYFFSKWVFKKYKGASNSAEELIKELDLT